jgi:hypothetical protein
MANEFKINLDSKPHLLELKNTDAQTFKTIVGTFVNIMEVAAEGKWTDVPESIHSTLSFDDMISGVLNAIMDTPKIDGDGYAALGADLHPLSLMSDTRKNVITNEFEAYDWRKHFALDPNEVPKEALEKVVRKILYLVRWFDVDVSKQTQQFPVIDAKDIRKLPFQPALLYQKQYLGELHIGKFMHGFGAFDCGEIEDEVVTCKACNIATLNQITQHVKVCARCNAGFKVTV